MKLMNKLQFAMIVLLSASLVACNNDDDNGGPSTPAPTGTMTGEMTVLDGSDPFEWSATSVTATYDTVFHKLIISAKGSAGDGIKIHLSDTVETTYTLGGMTSGFSEYYTNLNSYPYTTAQNDADPSNSIVVIDSNGVATISGNIPILRWYIVNPGFDDDEQEVVLQNGIFENVPVTYFALGFDANNSLSATVDGEAFEPTSFGITAEKSNSGFSVSGSTQSLNMISLMMTDTIVAGMTYDLGDIFSGYSGIYGSFTETSTSVSGELTISTLDRFNGTMSGTFNFETEDNNSVTEGAFDVEYE